MENEVGSWIPTKRFPHSLKFSLSKQEMEELVANCGWFGRMKHSSVSITAFTDHGIIMLASVLKSGVAIRASIRITNAFVSMRKALASIAPVMARLAEAERRQMEDRTRQIADQTRNEERFDVIFKAMDGGDFPPQKIFYEGQLWDARAFVNKLLKSAKKSLLLVDHFSRMPPRDSVAGGIRRFRHALVANFALVPKSSFSYNLPRHREFHAMLRKTSPPSTL